MAADRSDGNSPPAPLKPAGALAGIAQLNMGRVLRPLVMLATAVSAYLHARQFFFPDFVLRYNPDEAYVALLLAYSGHRELRRWSNDPQVITQTARRGEYFVVGWWTAYFIAVLIADHTLRYRVPDGLLSLCLQILGIFFGTLASQHLFKGKVQNQGVKVQALPAEPARRLEDRVLAYLKNTPGPVKRRDLEEEFDMSRSSIQRLMDSLQGKGLVEWVGASRNDPNGGFIIHRTGPNLPKDG
jgi:hypothetical protein